MHDNERKRVDAAGDHCYVVRAGEPVAEPRWRSSRVVLTNRRLVLTNDEGKRSIPHARIEITDVPDDLATEFGAGDATAFRVGENLVLVDVASVDAFDREYCRAALDGSVVLVKRPAVVGGVVQDVEWTKARVRFAGDRIELGFEGGESTTVDIDDVGTVESGSARVLDERRPVVEVEHADEDGRSVETHVSGTTAHGRAVGSLFSRAIDARRTEEYALDDAESEVLAALYSGVSPFEIADFVGRDVEEVEGIYATLLEVGAVDKVRERTEVALNAHGRNLASEAMNER